MSSALRTLSCPFALTSQRVAPTQGIALGGANGKAEVVQRGAGR
jgi:hypothetical protein